MQTLTFKEFKKIESNINKKLFSYINSNDYILKKLDNLEIDFPYFLEEDNKIAFNTWFSSDYLLDDGTTIIEMFLAEDPYKLSNLEKNFLLEKSKSHLSIYEILDYEDQYINVRDILLDREYRLWEPELIDALEEGELLLTRVAKTIESYNFLGDISHLPSFSKDGFLEDLILDFNTVRKAYPQLTMVDYLKRYALNIYRIYNDTIFTLMDIKEEIDSYIYDELGEFISYMERKVRDSKIKEYSANLISFYEYYLADQDMFLSDIDQVDLGEFINSSIKDGFIDSKSSLNSLIDSLKKYIEFLNKKDSSYKEAYQDILVISKNRFHLMDRLIHNDVFQIDNTLVNQVQLNREALVSLEDFESFLIILEEDQLELTKQNKYIKRKDLIKINNSFERQFIPLSKAPNQEDFPFINFAYHFSLNQGLVSIRNNRIQMNPKAISFLKLSEEEKFTLLFHYLWSHEFLEELVGYKETSLIQLGIENFLDMISKEDFSEKGDISLLEFSILNFILKYGLYLDLLGLIRYDINKSNYFYLTREGLGFFKALNKKNKNPMDSKIIDLEDYRGKK